MNAKIERLAVALAEAWRNDTTMPLPAADAAPASRAEAYAVQDRRAALIDDAVGGWKVGATVEAVQRLEGHDGPIPGRLFASRVFDSPARVPAARFGGDNVECEFAFRLTGDLPVRDRAYAADEIAVLLVFHPAIELSGSRYATASGGGGPRTHDVIADNGSGNGFVFGPGIAEWRDIAFETLPIVARIDGGGAIEAYTGIYRRDPLAVAVETVNDLVARGIPLKSGDYLSTGSLTVPTPIGGGQTLVAQFAELATLRVTLS